MTAPALSIVVPCYNEEACLAELHRRLERGGARRRPATIYEIVLVNDGSRDRSWAIDAASWPRSDPRLVAINLSRNHGHQLALTAGLDLCSGERILIIDADLQDPPELLPRHDGGDGRAAAPTSSMRCAARAPARPRSSAAPPSSSTGCSSKLAEIEIPLDTGDFRLMSRRALDALLSLPEQARFIRGMVAWVGFRQVPIAYDRAERHAGETKYPLAKMMRFALDAVTGFSTAPLRFASHIGLWLVAASVLLLVYIALRLPHRQRDPGLDLADAGRRRARRGADVRARHDRRISRPALHRGEAPAALHRLRDCRPCRRQAEPRPCRSRGAETIAASDTPRRERHAARSRSARARTSPRTGR